MTLPRGADLDALSVYVMLGLGVCVWGGVVWSQRPRKKKVLPDGWEVKPPKKPWAK